MIKGVLSRTPQKKNLLQVLSGLTSNFHIPKKGKYEKRKRREEKERNNIKFIILGSKQVITSSLIVQQSPLLDILSISFLFLC